jgi:Rhodopirellula transposase DDE domain
MDTTAQSPSVLLAPSAAKRARLARTDSTMPNAEPYRCQCMQCQGSQDHPDKEHHRQMNLWLQRLDRNQKRWYAGVEANRIGRGGDQQIALITGLKLSTIRHGQKELAASFPEKPKKSPRAAIGRPLAETKQPTLEAEIERLIENEIAGDPMTEQRWIRVSLRHLSQQLREKGLKACPVTVRRILRKKDISLRANYKKKNGVRANYPERDTQFQHIATKRQEFSEKGVAIISVDTKKKELIGNFKKNGKTWSKKAEEVEEHDFTSLATYRTIPYGIYDVNKNIGYVFVGISNDTPEFAVDAIVRWWREEGSILYGGAKELLILADSGGSNSFHTRAWKYQLQVALCDAFDLAVTVCHYPPGCSKWNPIEHRLFSFISINWAGKPFRTLDTMLGYIRGTSTTAGLTVKAFLLSTYYEKTKKISAKKFNQLDLRSHETCRAWNYTIYPRRNDSGIKVS